MLGKTKHTPSPDCPNGHRSGIRAEGVGSVTGFPLVADGEKRPMKVRRNGKLVAWAIDLSRPKKSQRDFFGTLFKSEKFGKKPTARIAVIKHNYKRHEVQAPAPEPVVKLSATPSVARQVFTLDKPLRIRKGQVVALTVPTWASNFASHITSADNQWRASRRGATARREQRRATSGDSRARAGRSRRSARCAATAATTRRPASSTGPTTCPPSSRRCLAATR